MTNKKNGMHLLRSAVCNECASEERMVSARGLLFGLLVWLLFCSGTATAAALVIEPSVTARLFYDDNAALTTNPHDFSAGSEILGALKLSRDTSAMKLQGVARMNMLLDAGGDVYRDKDNQLLSLLFIRKGELSQLQLRGSWRRDSIVRSVTVTDESEAGPEPDDDVDAGLVQVSVRRNRFVFKPSWSYQFSPRSEVGIGYGFDSVLFEDTKDTNLYDYQNHSLFGQHLYRITERDRVTTTLSMKQYRAEAAAEKRDNTSYNFLVGVKHNYSETTTGHFQIGWQQISYDNRAEDGETGSYLFRIYGEKRTGLTRFSARLGRSNFASGSGDVVNADELVFNMVRELTETLRFSLRVKAFQSESVSPDHPDANRRYLSFKPTLSWRITQWWSLDASYRYRRQKRDQEIGVDSAESNAIYVSMRYARPTPL